MTGAPDFHRFAFGAHAMAFVHIVYAIREPHAAVAIVGFNCIDCLAGAGGLNTLGRDLPAAFVGDRLAAFERESIVICELEN